VCRETHHYQVDAVSDADQNSCPGLALRQQMSVLTDIILRLVAVFVARRKASAASLGTVSVKGPDDPAPSSRLGARMHVASRRARSHSHIAETTRIGPHGGSAGSPFWLVKRTKRPSRNSAIQTGEPSLRFSGSLTFFP